jgi:hypothetical protein
MLNKLCLPHFTHFAMNTSEAVATVIAVLFGLAIAVVLALFLLESLRPQGVQYGAIVGEKLSGNPADVLVNEVNA